MAKVFIAVKPYSEAEKMVISELNNFNCVSRCYLGDIYGYTANFYETGFWDKNESEKLIKKIVSQKDTSPGLCRVVLAEDYVVMADFMESSVTKGE